MLTLKKSFAAVATVLAACSCTERTKNYEMGTYGYDKEFFAKHNIEFFELKSEDELSRMIIVPAYQGRVMTTTADGDDGSSFGWINYELIESGEMNSQFNPVGGEERFWLGPEGGPFSIYFKDGQEQVFENWVVPAVIDTDGYPVMSSDKKSMKFTKNAELTNASGTKFSVGIERTVSLLSKKEASELLNFEIPAGLKFVAYQTDNSITNRGGEPWTKESGALSIWLLGMFNPTPTTTVFIPYNTAYEGVVVNDDYFGKVPSDRLIAENGTIFFKIDGTYRSKIGLPAGRAKELCGSYDSDKGVLTLLWCSLPAGSMSYVNSKWGAQDDPYNGDVINSYNDGPVADGTIMGPFYEIETSSPAALLAPGQSMNHVQRIVHIQGDETKIAPIVRTLFDLDLSEIANKFK